VPRRRVTFGDRVNFCADTIPRRCGILYAVVTAVFIDVCGFLRDRRRKVTTAIVVLLSIRELERGAGYIFLLIFTLK
jgi:hypothetical protein